MTRSGKPSPESTATFEERLGILTEELELSIKWQRPCLLLVVYSSEYVRADVEAALDNLLIDLGQNRVHLSVRRRKPTDLVPFFREFKNPDHSVFLIDGFRWDGRDESEAYSTARLQREYFLERKIRAVVWLTPNEILKLAREVPDVWAYRERVIEFVESPKADQVLRQALDSAWQGTGEYAAEFDDTDAKISMREAMLTELPKGEEAISIRGNLLLTLGVLNWRKGNFEAADEQLQEALQIATKIQDNWFEAECFNAVALIKSSTERIDEAINAYKQAIELAPDQIFVWNNLGNLSAKVGRNDEAMVAFQKALEGNPRDAIAWNGLGNVHAKLGYVDDAIAAFRKSLQYTPTFAQPWCGLGDVYASTGRADEALNCYHKAIELNKKYIAPWLRLGALFAKQERHRDAVKAYRKAVDLDDRNGEAWSALGSAHLRAEAFEEAAAAFSRAIDLDRGNGQAYSNLAYAYAQQGKNKEAVSLLLRSIALMTTDSEKALSWNRLAEAYRVLDDYDNAVAAYKMADKLSSGATGDPRKGASAEATGLSNQAISDSQKASLSPASDGSPPIPESKAEASAETPVAAESAAPPDESQGRDAGDDAAPAWLFAEPETRERPTSAPRTLRTGPGDQDGTQREPEADEVPMQEAETRGGGQSGEELASKGSHAIEALEWTATGNTHFKQGALDEAVTAYNKAIQSDASYGVPYSNLALTYVTQGQFPEAILLYQKSIELLESEQEQAISWNGLGNAYRCLNDYANAVAAYQRASQLDPETSGIRDRADNFQPHATPRTAKSWIRLGELLLKTGAMEKAEGAFRKAIELEPEAGRAHSNLARVMASQGKHREAANAYKRSIGLLDDDKSKADAWNGLGNAYRKLKDYSGAFSAYKKAVALADEGVSLLTRTRLSLLSNIFTKHEVEPVESTRR